MRKELCQGEHAELSLGGFSDWFQPAQVACWNWLSSLKSSTLGANEVPVEPNDIEIIARLPGLLFSNGHINQETLMVSWMSYLASRTTHLFYLRCFTQLIVLYPSCLRGPQACPANTVAVFNPPINIQRIRDSFSPFEHRHQ